MTTHKEFELAKEKYEKLGVNVEEAFKKLKKLSISLNCWQGDDIGGFEVEQQELSGGIDVTGNYPGKATTPAELRGALGKALSLIPGTHRVNRHSMYAEPAGERGDRDALKPQHFKNWVEWAKSNNLGLDFNPTLFSHPKTDDGLTLAHPDEEIRDFWIRHGQASRRISE